MTSIELTQEEALELFNALPEGPLRDKVTATAFPLIAIKGSESYANAYEKGKEWEKRWPGQDCSSLAYAIAYNGDSVPPEIASLVPEEIVLLDEGENDERQWVWAITFTDSRYRGWWVVYASCDYTGWDCQSSMNWVRGYEVAK